MNKKLTLFMIFGGVLFLGISKCPLYDFVGIPCPGCGMTRAWLSFLTLDFATAFSMHPLFLMPLLVFVPKMRNKWGFWICFGILILVYILRMCLLFPHTPPMNFNNQSLLGGFLR